MLRANLLQPLSNRKAISERHDLVAELLADNQLYETLKEEVSKFRNFELITAKFIQSPKEKNIRSLKCYLSAIYSLAHMCLLLKRFHHRV
jgi:DNA mismatch repair ATPase MutS